MADLARLERPVGASRALALFKFRCACGPYGRLREEGDGGGGGGR